MGQQSGLGDPELHHAWPPQIISHNRNVHAMQKTEPQLLRRVCLMLKAVHQMSTFHLCGHRHKTRSTVMRRDGCQMAYAVETEGPAATTWQETRADVTHGCTREMFQYVERGQMRTSIGPLCSEVGLISTPKRDYTNPSSFGPSTSAV